MLNLYITLVIAHILADFPLQVGSIYELKVRSNWGLALHVGIHLMVMMMLIESPLQWWLALVLLGGIHFFIDWAKLRFPIKPQVLGFVVDQFWHALSLVPLTLLFPSMQPAIPEQYLYLDLGLALISPLLLTFWTYTWDLKNQFHDARTSSIVEWGNKNLLLISQVIGFIIVAIVGYQRLSTLF